MRFLFTNDISISRKELLKNDIVAQKVRNLPATQKTQVRSLGQEDPLEKAMATRFRILAWDIPWTEGVWQAAGHRVAKESDMT